MKRGRPIRSTIRQNVIEIIHCLGHGYGYEIAKIYNEVFPEVTQRSIYYHLKKGVQTGEILFDRVKKEEGDFSWGNVVHKNYYILGKEANPSGNEQVKAFLKRWRK